MTTGKSCVRIVGLICAIGLTIGVVQVQSQLLTGTPAESPSPPKPRTQKRTEANPPVESGASPSAADSLAAASPTPKPTRRKTTAEVVPSPSPTPVASPTPRKFKFRFPRLFKPKRSPSASPIGVNSAPVSGSGAAGKANAAPQYVMRALSVPLQWLTTDRHAREAD